VTLFGALIAVVINEMMFRQSYCAGKQLRSPSLVANAFEKRSDALTSIAVFAGIAGAKLGFHYLDPLAAILVGFYILKFSVKMLIEAFKGLLDTSLEPEAVRGIRGTVEEIGGVQGIDAVRTREIGQQVWIDLEILVDGDASVGDVARIRDDVKRAVADEVGRPARIEVYLKPVAG
jgi:cation diffusion facilitator family transporter